jgi:hypothetical protein
MRFVVAGRRLTKVKFAIMTLLIGLVSMGASAAGIDGKWISEMQVGDADGKTYSHTSTFNLKSEGGALTGTIVQVSEAPWMAETTGRSFEIKDGKVDGDKFSFKVTRESKQGERTVVYEGTIEGDRLKGTTKYRGIGITQPFEAKRAN